ncbi:hypothetical protein HRI_002302200 [Hibiscus trionum]|uniref:Uncharacterized protein n=1 Tax=Hibiscus trionum TaxID=183268 RepID=A0A9W7M391_HIBTR|nr:hypothetical protein HRI_002302200 [Hibiscus trionum]
MVKPVKQRNRGLLAFRANPPTNLGVKKNTSLSSRVSLIPREARRLSRDGGLEGYEPVSPRVSCIGQIQCEIKTKRGVTVRKPKQVSSILAHAFAEQVKRRVLIGRKRGYESDVFAARSKAVEAAPSFRQIRQFSKGRSTVSGLDSRICNVEEKGKALSRRKRCYEPDVSGAQVTSNAAPSLQQMRQFGKARSTLSEFDWRTYDAGEKGVKRKRN